MKISFYVVLEN